jgi:hypothetical protein
VTDETVSDAVESTEVVDDTTVEATEEKN